jgi:hypothetical protein
LRQRGVRVALLRHGVFQRLLQRGRLVCNCASAGAAWACSCASCAAPGWATGRSICPASCWNCAQCCARWRHWSCWVAMLRRSSSISPPPARR